MVLKKNVGHADSIIRVVIGAIILIAGLYYENYWGLLGVIPVLSGALSYCPLYRLFNISTINPGLEREN